MASRHHPKASRRSRTWLLPLGVFTATVVLVCLFSFIYVLRAPSGGFNLHIIRWVPFPPPPSPPSPESLVLLQDPLVNVSPPPSTPWWKTEQPHISALRDTTPKFPKAGLWTALTAVSCLRKAFAEPGSQDMRVFSQWGEDGILQAIFMCIGVSDKFFAEFGSEDGTECTTRWLRESQGFKGLLMDGNNTNLDINLQQEMLFAENITAALHKHKVPYPVLDHMTIDLDLNTWHVTAAVLDGGWRPRSLTVEFNRNFLPHQSFTTVYWPSRAWQDEDCYFGGSALAFVRLLSPYRYQLVAVDNFGINLFFVHGSALGWWPSAVHANTPTQSHPLHQVWPRLHRPCPSRAWVDVPENVDLNAWDQTIARRPVLFHLDRLDHFRVMFEAHPGDAGNPEVEKHREDQAAAEFSRYQTGRYTLHEEEEANAFAARLRVPQYAGLRVVDLPNDPQHIDPIEVKYPAGLGYSAA